MPDLQERNDAHSLVDKLPPERLAAARNLMETMLDVGPVATPEATYEREVARIPGVTATVAWRDEEIVHLWTLIPEYDEQLANQVYAVEAELQRTFADSFDFFVHVCDYGQLKATLPRKARIQVLNEPALSK